jgi:hypothetical protein
MAVFEQVCTAWGGGGPQRKPLHDIATAVGNIEKTFPPVSKDAAAPL